MKLITLTYALAKSGVVKEFDLNPEHIVSMTEYTEPQETRVDLSTGKAVCVQETRDQIKMAIQFAEYGINLKVGKGAHDTEA